MFGKNRHDQIALIFMKIDDDFLKSILVDSGLILLEDFQSAQKHAKENKQTLYQTLIEKAIVSDEQLSKLIADEIGFPYVNLEKLKIDKSVLGIIPEIVAKKQKIIIFGRVKEGLKAAMANPDDLEIREFIERKTGEKVIPHFASENNILSVLKYYKREIKEEFEDIIGKSLEEFHKAESKAPQSLPIIKVVEFILSYGYDNRASDVHLEPYSQKTVLRYRIDGVLHDVLTLPEDIHDFLVARIKILSKLRTDEHQTAQDGHFFFQTSEGKVDVRVSVVPIEEGEKIVMRLLTERSRKFELEDLGFQKEDLEIFKRNIKKPWGMILATGPTGSGKTTTLYGILKILNTREINICTIEDPVEYDIEGINQIQVNPKTNLTFLDGLRAIIRQDPNIIMVGEIRDPETAQLAINAAMTGHLVLSTFHATDAATVLVRLIDMAVEPFLITSTANLVISQRLVRKICPRCIESIEVAVPDVAKMLSQNLIERLFKGKKVIRVFSGRGCSLCQKTGYLGRIGIFELLEMTDTIKELVMQKANAVQIKNKAQELGMTTMIEDGLKKVEEGITTLEEVLRAIKE